jgi:PST family polysaccharide transporter
MRIDKLPVPYLKKVMASGDAAGLVKNFISLLVVQGLNYILPLITVPYITRVLGVANFGTVNIAAAIMTYFSIFTDYGFNLSATRDISINREDKEKVSLIFSSVMVVKAILSLIGFIALSAIVFSIEILRADFSVYLISYGIVFGNVLFPIWYFQGIEKMKYITYLNIICRGIITVLIFMLVKNREHMSIYVGLNSISSIAIGLISLGLVFIKFKVRFRMPDLANIKNQMVEGWYVFVSSISIAVYTSSTTIILGLMVGKDAAGYYAGADKIRVAVQGLITPLFQTVYPYVNKLAKESTQRVISFIKKELVLFSAAGIVGSLIVVFKADFLVNIFAGKDYNESVGVLKILAFAPLLVLIGNIVTVQGMLSLGLKKEYSRIYMITSTVGIVTMILFIYLFGIVGAAYSVLIIEVLVVALTLFYLKKSGISLLK